MESLIIVLPVLFIVAVIIFAVYILVKHSDIEIGLRNKHRYFRLDNYQAPQYRSKVVQYKEYRKTSAHEKPSDTEETL